MFGSAKISRSIKISIIRSCLSWIVSITSVIVIWAATKLLPQETRQHLFPAISDWIFDLLKLDKFAKFGNEVGYKDTAGAIKHWVEFSPFLVQAFYYPFR